MSRKRNFSDDLMLRDKISSKSLWADTSVSAYYGYHHDFTTGKTEYGETIFEDCKNIVVVGGVQHLMEMIYGVKGPLTVPTLYDQMQIGLPNATHSSKIVQTPNGPVEMANPFGMNVWLFGVGLSGSAENSIVKYPVDFRENAIQMNKVAEDGTNLDGIMIPFRYTTQALSSTDQKKYFGKKVETTYNAYYLKAFDNRVAIKFYWKTGKKIDQMTEVTPSEMWANTSKTPVVSVAEMHLKLSEDDINEWFSVKGRIDEPRINTLGLYTGYYNQASGDYENVRLFSKLYIPTENLSLSKEIDFVYRTFGS